MRKKYFAVLIVGILISLTQIVNAQADFNFNVNLSSLPVWGPAGYDSVLYYYLPDIDTYYNVQQHRFIYRVRGRWVISSSLPSRYRDFDLYKAHKVVLNEDKPYLQDRVNREKYSSFKDLDDQQAICDSRDSKYFVIKDHPQHNNWIEQQKKDNDLVRKSGYNTFTKTN